MLTRYLCSLVFVFSLFSSTEVFPGTVDTQGAFVTVARVKEIDRPVFVGSKSPLKIEINGSSGAMRYVRVDLLVDFDALREAARGRHVSLGIYRNQSVTLFHYPQFFLQSSDPVGGRNTTVVSVYLSATLGSAIWMKPFIEIADGNQATRYWDNHHPVGYNYYLHNFSRSLAHESIGCGPNLGVLSGSHVQE